MNSTICYARGKFLPVTEASVSVNDLVVQRGYGIFDFLRVSGNVPLFLEDHLDRFFHSAKEMRLSLKESREEISEVIFHLIKQNNLHSSGVRILLSGGESPDGYRIIEPSLVIIQIAITPPPDQLSFAGFHLLTYPFQRQLSHVKTTDYLMAIWLQQWLKKGGGDDILYHQDGIVSECPRSNFFVVTIDGKLVTPSRNMLSGITRKQVIRFAEELGIPVEERDIHLKELPDFSEAFITSSTKRLISVSQINEHIFPKKEENSITFRLWAHFKNQELIIIK